MNKYLFCLAICFVTQHNVVAKITNGYSPHIQTVMRSFDNLRALLKCDDINIFQRAQLRVRINQHIDYISNFRRTEEMLHQFRKIAPALYGEIDSIRDKQGREVDVYVKLVLDNEMELDVGGITSLAHADDDAHAYYSSYGINTVSVKIRMLPSALTILAHEFGHVKYQVPNLAAYTKYYNDTYRSRYHRLKLIGHNLDDCSGKSANDYVKRFKKYHSDYVRMTRKDCVEIL